MKKLKTSPRSVKRKANPSSKSSKRDKACDECPSTFSTLNGLTQHKKIHKKLEELNYRCSICGETFYDAEKFRKHMFMHDVKLYKCESCGDTFKYLQSYMRHLKDYQEPHYFPCDKCKRIFKRLIFFNKHFCNSKDGNKTWSSNDSSENSSDDVPISELKEKEVSYDLFEFKCKECNWIFPSKFNLKRHLDIYSDRHFTFPCCGNQFKKHSDIRSHDCSDSSNKTITNIPIMSVNSLIQTEERTKYTCDVCPASFFRLHSLKRHKLKNPGEHDFYCNDCIKRFPDSVTLKKHLCIFKGNKTFQCSCLQVFENMETFKPHIGGEKKPYRCCACKMRCITFNNLVNHIRVHTREKPYVCPYCNKSFSVQTSLTIHLRNHTGDKPYKCSKCSYSTVTKWNLELHERKHKSDSDRKDDKKFLCTKCGLGFYMKHHLRKHLITHSPKKDHKCELCGKGFSQRCYLLKHSKTHIENYKCPKCNQALDEKDFYKHYADTGHFSFVCEPCKEVFITKTKLRKHLRSFHEKFVCQECGKKFTDRERWEKHIDKNHKDSKKKKIVF